MRMPLFLLRPSASSASAVGSATVAEADKGCGHGLRRIVMRMTPFAPREPYAASEPPSLRTSMDEMSRGSISGRTPSGPGFLGTPSMTYSG